jgi:hypothetical protein
MSAMGDRHVQRKEACPLYLMSALPSKADMCIALGDFRFGPKADIVGNSVSSNFQRIPARIKL